MTEQDIRLVVVDDHRVVRAGIIAILTEAARLIVVGEASTAQGAVDIARRLSPDLVLMDMRLPDASGVEACRRIKALQPPPKVVALTSFAEEPLVFEAIAAGVDGYLLKDSDDDALISALFAVADGEQVLSPAITQKVMGRFRSSGTSRERSPLALLTPRERSLLHLISEGSTYKEAGARLGVAEKTVRNTVSLMMQKLGLESRSQLVALYARSESRH